MRNALAHWRRRYREVFGPKPPNPASGAEVLAHLREYARAAPEQTDCLVMHAELLANPDEYREHVARVRMYRAIASALEITEKDVENADQRLRELGFFEQGD